MTADPGNKTLLLQRLENHIRGGGTHFGADVYAWDVVNEVDRREPARRPAPQPLVQHHRAWTTSTPRSGSPARWRPTPSSTSTTTTPTSRPSATSSSRWCSSSRPRACRSTASVTRCTTTSSTRRRQSIIDAIDLFDTRAWSSRDHRAGREHLQRVVPDAVHQLHRNPLRPPQPRRLQLLGYFQAFRQLRGRSSRSHLGTVGRQDLADVVDAGGRAAAVRHVAEEEARLLGGRRSAAAAGRRPVRDPDRRADHGAGRPGDRLHHHGQEQRRPEPAALPADQ